MRVFCAFEIPAHIKDYLSQVSRAMSKTVPGVRWVKPEGQHITIHFFGEISESRAEEIKNALKGSGPFDPVNVTLKCVDAFPDKRRPRVIVATLDEGVDIIGTIYHDIEDRFTALGFEREKRAFKPHITFGRMKTPVPLLERDIRPLDCPGFSINRIVLYRSILGREGATYEALFEKELGGS